MAVAVSAFPRWLISSILIVIYLSIITYNLLVHSSYYLIKFSKYFILILPISLPFLSPPLCLFSLLASDLFSLLDLSELLPSFLAASHNVTCNDLPTGHPTCFCFLSVDSEQISVSPTPFLIPNWLSHPTPDLTGLPLSFPVLSNGVFVSLWSIL